MKKQSLHFLGWTGWIPVCLMAVVGSTLVACSDDDDAGAVAPEPFTTALTFSSAEKDTTLIFEAYGDWKASVTKSDVAEIQTAKTGKQGKVEMKVRIFENKTFAPREAEIRINDGRASANVYKITQNPALRVINFSKTLNFTQSDTVFTDTVIVTSNAAWEIASMPAWIKSWEKTDPNLSPEEGVQTSIQLVFIADHSKFTPAKMEGEIQFKDKNDAQYPLTAEFAGFTPYISFDVTELVLQREEESSDTYKGKVIVSSNVNWTIDKQDAAFVGEIDNITNTLGNALVTENTIWVTMDQSKLTTDEQVGTLHFKDQVTSTDVPLSVKFVGTGANYINFEREKIFDKAFDAQGMDPNSGEPIPGAVTSVDFTVFAAEPVDFIIIKYDNGYPWHEEVTWAGVDPVEPITRAPIKSGTYTLWVQDRWSFMPGVDQEQIAMLFVVPEGTTVDDLFVGDSDDLKPEWEGKGTHFKQKGLVIEYFMTLGDITEGSTVNVPQGGIDKLLTMDTDCENWTVYIGDEPVSQKDWLNVENSGDGWHLKVDANNTGVSRKVLVSFRAYRGEGVEEQILISFWVSQGK